MSEHQITIVSLDELISKNHQYRKFKSLFNFKAIESDNNYKDGILRLFNEPKQIA